MGKAKARRRDALAALGRDPLDVLVVGGGINGAGIARDAAMRGLRVGLVERGDLASGTSSRSSKLIHGGLRYLEQGDVRLVLEAALSAAGEGALIVSYAEVAGFVKEGGRIVGARVVDRLGRGEVVARARVVVNAAGPWVDRVVALDAPETPPRLRLTKGVHVVVPHERVGNRAAVVLSAVADRRVMFVIPWGAHTLVGTTDTDHPGGPDVPPVVEPPDVAYLLDTVNHYFPAARLAPADVVGAFAGLRPLVAPRGKATMSPSAVSREEEVFSSASGLISIAGGKLSTYRLVAKTVVDRVVDALRAAGDPRRFPRSRTGEVPLPGGAAP